VDASRSLGLLETLNIKGIPTFMFYKNGQLMETMTGSHLKKEHIRLKTEELRQWQTT
jgi:hypothetical protein